MKRKKKKKKKMDICIPEVRKERFPNIVRKGF